MVSESLHIVRPHPHTTVELAEGTLEVGDLPPMVAASAYYSSRPAEQKIWCCNSGKRFARRS